MEKDTFMTRLLQPCIGILIRQLRNSKQKQKKQGTQDPKKQRVFTSLQGSACSRHDVHFASQYAIQTRLRRRLFNQQEDRRFQSDKQLKGGWSAQTEKRWENNLVKSLMWVFPCLETGLFAQLDTQRRVFSSYTTGTADVLIQNSSTARHHLNS